MNFKKFTPLHCGLMLPCIFTYQVPFTVQCLCPSALPKIPTCSHCISRQLHYPLHCSKTTRITANMVIYTHLSGDSIVVFKDKMPSIAKKPLSFLKGSGNEYFAVNNFLLLNICDTQMFNSKIEQQVIFDGQNYVRPENIKICVFKSAIYVMWFLICAWAWQQNAW